MEFDTIAKNIIGKIATALNGEKLPLASFLTDRLAEQSPENGRSQFQRVKLLMCDSGLFDDRPFLVDDFESKIIEALTDPAKTTFLVRIEVEPVSVSLRDLRGMGDVKDKFILEAVAGTTKRLMGFIFRKNGRHAHEVALDCLNEATSDLDYLRLRHYILTHIRGVISVSDISDGNGQVKTQLFSLPEPLWRPDSNPREMIRLPPFVDRLIKEASSGSPRIARRWRAACHHLSSAYSLWAENPHAAAVQVWCAIESFSKGRGTPRNLAESYIPHVRIHIARAFANAMSAQADSVNELGGAKCDWIRWNRKLQCIDEWLNQVLSDGSGKSFKKWRQPVPPEILFGREVGFFPHVVAGAADGFLDTVKNRLDKDIELLASVRHKFVHEGTLLFPRATVEYLARVGLEMLISCMEEENAIWQMGRNSSADAENIAEGASAGGI